MLTHTPVDTKAKKKNLKSCACELVNDKSQTRELVQKWNVLIGLMFRGLSFHVTKYINW